MILASGFCKDHGNVSLYRPADRITLEIFTSHDGIDFGTLEKQEPRNLLFYRDVVRLTAAGDYMIGVVNVVREVQVVHEQVGSP